MFSKRIAIDLGTTRTRIFAPGKGIVINEPTVVAMDVQSNKVIAVGDDAIDMVGRTPEAIRAYRPIKSGVIADYVITEQMLKHFMNKALGRVRLRLPEVMISISSGATSTERRAALDAAKSAGMQHVHLIQSAIAAGLGAAVPINEPTGNLIVDIGGGTTEIAVISLSGVVARNSIRVGGQSIDADIVNYIRNTHGVGIGERTAEETKMLIGSAMYSDDNQATEIHGRDLIGGLPKTIKIHPNDLVPVIEESLEKIIRAIRNTIEQTPPELVSDIAEHGIMLTGGTVQLKNLDRVLSKIIGAPAIVAQDPLLCTVKGAGTAITNLEDYKKSLLGWRP
jgi:rod shape-determining protein MreB